MTTPLKKSHLRLLIQEALTQVLLEQDPMMGAPPPPPPAPPMGGPADVAPAPPGMDAAAPPTAEQEGLDSQPGGITVDKIIERLNLIRSGKSLTEPEVYGKMRALVQGLAQEQRTLLDFVLQELEKVVAKVVPLPDGGVAPVPTPEAGGPPPPPPTGAAPPGAPPPPPPPSV